MTLRAAHAGHSTPKRTVWRPFAIETIYNQLAAKHPCIGEEWNSEMGRKIMSAKELGDNVRAKELCNSLALHNLRLLFKIVNSSSIHNFAFCLGIKECDLLQAGFTGLLEAALDFDPSKGEFSKRAGVFISVAMLEFLNHSKSVNVNRTALSVLISLELAFTVIDTFDHPVTEEDIPHICVSNGKAENMLRNAISTEGGLNQLREKVLSLRATVGNTLNVVRFDAKSDSRNSPSEFVRELSSLPDTVQTIAIEEVLSVLEDKSVFFNDNQLFIMEHRLLKGDLTLQAVADHLHLSRERVRQIEVYVLNALRDALGVEGVAGVSMSVRKNPIMDAKIKFLDGSGVPVELYSRWNLSALPLEFLQRVIPYAVMAGNVAELPFLRGYGEAMLYADKLAEKGLIPPKPVKIALNVACAGG